MRTRRADRISRMICIGFLKLVWVYPFKILWWLLKKIYYAIRYRSRCEDDDDYYYEYEDEWIEDEDDEQQIAEEIDKYSNLPEMPEMVQVFPIDDTTVIGVQFVSMCPDETAHIRVIGELSFSQLYRRRVYKEGYRRYFKLNNQKFYLRDSTTQPINPVQAKEGK